MALPEKLQIRWMPDLHTSHIGRFNKSEQFFLAQHVVHSITNNSANREYVALYCFDRSGILQRHKILGPFDSVTEKMTNALLTDLGPYEFMDICVAPFQVTFDGHLFGLIPDTQNGIIQLEPGSMITFMEPWDGEYCT